jgi:hypothetical protein
MLGKLLGEGKTAIRGGIDGVVDGYLAVLVVQPSIDVFPALLENLLAEHDRRRRCIREEIVLRYMAPRNGSSAVVAQMEDTGLDAKPGIEMSTTPRSKKSESAYHDRYRAIETQM